MKINELQSGQIVKARVGRAGPDRIDWRPWCSVALYIQRTPKNEVCIIAVRDFPEWAQYDPRHDWNEPFDSDPNGTLTAEDFYLQIEGLER